MTIGLGLLAIVYSKIGQTEADGLSYSIGLVDLDYLPSRNTEVFAVELI